MANVEQFERVVTGAGAVAIRSCGGRRERSGRPSDAGRFDNREVPLRGDLGKDIQAAEKSRLEKSSQAPRA